MSQRKMNRILTPVSAKSTLEQFVLSDSMYCVLPEDDRVQFYFRYMTNKPTMMVYNFEKNCSTQCRSIWYGWQGR